jgi:hypothetical protein
VALLLGKAWWYLKDCSACRGVLLGGGRGGVGLAAPMMSQRPHGWKRTQRRMLECSHSLHTHKEGGERGAELGMLKR